LSIFSWRLYTYYSIRRCVLSQWGIFFGPSLFLPTRDLVPSSTKIIMRNTIVPGPVPHWLYYLSEMLKFKKKKEKKIRKNIFLNENKESDWIFGEYIIICWIGILKIN
jgi:hypothetical protein